MGDKNQLGLPARRAAVKFIKKILREGKSLDDLFSFDGGSGILQSLTAKDRALVRQICATSLRRKGQITAHLNTYLEKPLPRKSGDAREILLCGAAQILYMDVPAHAAIDLSVQLASYDRNARHFKGLINAVLRRLASQESTEDEDRDILLNIPDWLLENWRAQYSDEQISLMARAHVKAPPLDISCKTDTGKWAEELQAKILPTGSLRLHGKGKSPGLIQNLPGFKQGEWWVQDTAASLPVKILGDVEGINVLELCAAPGGKTMQLAANGAHVTALDRSSDRLRKLEDNLERTGLKAGIICDDATSFTPEKPPEMILLDAPCSATGTLRRHPDLPYIKDKNAFQNLITLQSKLLTRAATILAPGGTLLYCTCSLERSEGEAQIETFLQKHENFNIAPIKIAENWNLPEAITPEGYMRTLPFFYDPQGGMDGFFIAKLTKSTTS